MTYSEQPGLIPSRIFLAFLFVAFGFSTSSRSFRRNRKIIHPFFFFPWFILFYTGAATSFSIRPLSFISLPSFSFSLTRNSQSVLEISQRINVRYFYREEFFKYYPDSILRSNPFFRFTQEL